MKNKSSRIFKTLFCSLAILSVLLLAGCALWERFVTRPVASKPESSGAVPTEKEMATAAAPAAPTPQPGQGDEKTVKTAPPPENKEVPKAEDLAGETSQDDPVAIGSGFLKPSTSQDAKIIQGRLAVIGLYQGPVDGIWGKGSQAALRKFKEKESLSHPDRWDKETQLALFKETSRNGRTPKVNGQNQIESASILLNPWSVKDAKIIQSRLAEIGLYQGAIDGIWGKGTQTALKTFKEKKGLKNLDKWDKETQRLLFKKTS